VASMTLQKRIDLRRDAEWRRYKIHDKLAPIDMLRERLAADGLELTEQDIDVALIKRTARGFTYCVRVWAVRVPGSDRHVYEMVDDRLTMIGLGRFVGE